MAHKFDPAHSGMLHDRKWRGEKPPEEVLTDLGLGPGDSFVDIGCGNGFFTLPALSIVGPGGTVTGLDTSHRMLRQIKDPEAERDGRLRLLESGEYSFPLPDDSVTFVLMSLVLHELDDKERFLREAKRILTKGGILAIIDWEKKETSEGPPVKHRISTEEALEEVKKAGFINPVSGSLTPVHYTIKART